MSLRDLILDIIIPCAFIWGLTSGKRGILVLTWICFQRPQDFAYGFLHGQPLFQIAFILAFGSCLIHRELRPRFPPALVLMMMLLAWITLSAEFAFSPARAWQNYAVYVPTLWAMPLIYCFTIRDLKFLKQVLWVAVGSLALTGFKTGAVLMAHGGSHLTGNINGFVGDNNGFALVLCLVVPMLMGLRSTLPDKKWVRPLFYFVVWANLMCIVFTKSRGAFLTIALVALAAGVLSGRALKSIATFVVVGVFGYLVIPASYFSRLSTLGDISDNASAMGRIQNWVLSWNEALLHPVLGVGPFNHMLYNAAHNVDVTIRVAHSIYFQTLGELGFPGLFLYLLFFAVVFAGVWRTWRMMVPLAQQYPELAWVKDFAFWLTCGLIGYAFGSAFLNTLYTEFPWYAMILGSMLLPLTRAELARSGASATNRRLRGPALGGRTIRRTGYETSSRVHGADPASSD